MTFCQSVLLYQLDDFIHHFSDIMHFRNVSHFEMDIEGILDFRDQSDVHIAVPAFHVFCRRGIIYSDFFVIKYILKNLI